MAIDNTTHLAKNYYRLICSQASLARRWKKDTVAEWRSSDQWLNESLSSLDGFSKRTGALIIDTSERSAGMVADEIIGLV